MKEKLIEFKDLLKLARDLSKSPNIDRHSRIQALIGYAGCAKVANQRYERRVR